MLTSAQRERILCHLRRGWKLPDSLVQELWTAYETLEQALTDQGPDALHTADRAAEVHHATQRQYNPSTYDVDY